MATVLFILGGMIGFTTALVALVLGVSLATAGVIWIGTGLAAPLVILLIARVPRRQRAPVRA